MASPFLYMDELIRDGELAIRLMLDGLADYECMAKWLTDVRVLEFFEGRDNPFPLARVIEEYAPRVLLAEANTPCFLLYRAAPIGYIQYYPVDDSGVFGMDQFIGEPEFWNQGIGTRAVALLLSYLFDVRGVKAVVIDPHVDNLRAVRCYEKCGFRKIRMLPKHELHEGILRDCWLMQADQRPELPAASASSPT